MRLSDIGRWLGTALLALTLLSATPARAEWLKAESERFIVYGDGNARELIAFTRKLETFDRVLRTLMGLDATVAPPRKLPIYLVDSRGLRRVSPNVGENVAGFYAARDEDIFAVALRGGMGDDVSDTASVVSHESDDVDDGAQHTHSSTKAVRLGRVSATAHSIDETVRE